MSVRRIAAGQAVGRAWNGLVALALAGLASEVGFGALVAAGGGLVWSLVALAEALVLLDVARDDGETLLTTGERVRIRGMDRVRRASMLESATLAFGGLGVALAWLLPPFGPSSVPGLALALLLALLEAVFFAVQRQAARSRRAFVALRERRPADAIAALDGEDLSLAQRWNDALLVAEAWVMRGDRDRALGAIACHRAQRGVALRDALWRLSAEPAAARAVLATLAPEHRLDRVRRDELAVFLAVHEGRGAAILAESDAMLANLAALPGEYGDSVRIGLAAAARQAGRPDEAAARLASLARPLSDYAYGAAVWPTVWRWISPDAPAPAAARPLPSPPADVFAPPAVDRPSRARAPRFLGAEPVRSLPIAVRRSRLGRVAGLVTAASTAALVLPSLLLVPAMAVIDAEIAAYLGGLVLLVAVLGATTVGGEALAWAPRAAGEPTVVLADDTRYGLRAFRAAGWLDLAQPLGAAALIAGLLIALLGPTAVLALPIAGLAWNVFRPYVRGRALTASVLAGDDAAALALCDRWLAAWAVVPATRAAVEVHRALALARRGDVAGAEAAVAFTQGIPEGDWCRAWLRADRLEPAALERAFADDDLGWWRVTGLAACAIASGCPADRAALEGVARALPNAFGDVAWLLLALDRGAEGRAVLHAAGVDPRRLAWVAALWPSLAGRYAALV